MQRWRHDTAPCGDALFGIFRLGARVPGGLYLLLPDDLSPPGRLTGVCKIEIIATNRPHRPWILAYAGMTEWAR